MSLSLLQLLGKYLTVSIIVAIVCYYIFEKWLYGKLIKFISASGNKWVKDGEF